MGRSYDGPAGPELLTGASRAPNGPNHEASSIHTESERNEGIKDYCTSYCFHLQLPLTPSSCSAAVLCSHPATDPKHLVPILSIEIH